jgi:hypothetical protein
MTFRIAYTFTLYTSTSRNKYDSGRKLVVTTSSVVHEIAFLKEDLLTCRMNACFRNKLCHVECS